MKYDLCLTWEWVYDTDFVKMLEAACQFHQVTFLQITPANLDQALHDLKTDQVSFKAFLDRASDSNEAFLPLVGWARSQPIYRINPFGIARHAWDKAEMHYAFTNAGLDTSHSIKLPSFKSQPHISPLLMSSIGPYFSIKPVHGGGGSGLLIGATSWDEVLKTRQEIPEDQYILQDYVIPGRLGERQAWFRIIYCSGEVFPCWWDTHTHIYTPVTLEEEYIFNLYPLKEITNTMAQVCQLDLFSTEIARTPTERFKIVDYINDPIDLRLQSDCSEGVPDKIVQAIADRLANMVNNLPEPINPPAHQPDYSSSRLASSQ